MRRALVGLLMLMACGRGTRMAEPPAADVARRTVRVHGNPLLPDSLHYTADPAPLVVGNRLYVLTGRDRARPAQNDFVMPEWQLLTTTGDPLQSTWTHYPHAVRPEQVFRWAAPARAYAGQIVRGVDGRFYLYAPVIEAASTNRDQFAIGVAVATTPEGPWRDAHPEGPIVSQSRPVPNTIQNIDPTVLVDSGRVFLYWGTFGKLKGVELAPDMVTVRGTPIDITTLTGFFEAAWLFKRGTTYYLAYAANTAGPASPCTEAVYYACLAYGTAPSPLGPWTYRGVFLPPVSSTTSHPGIVAYRGDWWLVYHTADAPGGGHFRRSVAMDRLTFDDTQQPARIRPLVRSGGTPYGHPLTGSLAMQATLSASNEPVPVQYWLRALNDGTVRENPLPPDMWATWTPNNPPQQWVQYTWRTPVTLGASSMVFWADHPAGSGVGVAPPRAWHLEYWRDSAWVPVSATSPYTAVPNAENRVTFTPVTTTRLRVVFDASTDSKSFAAVAAQEWRADPPQ
ncbi:MAG: family 43 glycosylhydrolase [Gemmatimonadaceae bacterium]|nr:family 43 glycosylhydrolase [Gemmatimonadaceae bacterium]